MNNPKTNNTAICTICSVNYLDRALGLYTSVQKQKVDCDFYIILADTKREISAPSCSAKILWIEDLDYPNLKRNAFRYNVIEFNTAIKPWVLMYLTEQYEKSFYLDPDMCVFSNLEELFAIQEYHNITLTPHQLTPYRGSGRPNDQDLLRFGAFNLGYLGTKRSKTTLDFLKWWDEKLQAACFYEPSIGLGVDQKWIDLAPTLFEGIHIIRDPGYNIAFWNLHERHISLQNDKPTVNKEHPVHIGHFSSFVQENTSAIANKQTRHTAGSRPDFELLTKAYSKILNEAPKLTEKTSTEYGYSTFSDGKLITPSLRRFYTHIEIHEDKEADPFEKDSKPYRFAKKHNLHHNSKYTFNSDSFKETSKHKSATSIISLALRFTLRLLGPMRYFDLMRYAGARSSILNQGDLLK